MTAVIGCLALGLALLSVVGLARAVAPAELTARPAEPRIVIARRLEDPRAIGDRLVADLASRLCERGASPSTSYREGRRQLWIQREEVYGVEQWTVSVVGALVAAERDLERLPGRIAEVIRHWRSLDSAEREERDCRTGGGR